MRPAIRGLAPVALARFRATPGLIEWTGVAPAGQVADVAPADVASWIGAHTPRVVRASDVSVRRGRHPGEIIIGWHRVDPLATPIDAPAMAERSIWDGTTVGRDEAGDDVVLRWTGGHTVVVGTTGSGKSTLLRYVAASLSWCPDGDIWVAETGKRGEDYDGLVIDRMARTPADLDAMMRDLDALAEERAGTPRATRRPLVVVVDEFLVARDSLAVARSQGAREADRAWTIAFSLWRSAAISLIVGAQRGTGEYVPPGPRANAMQRVCLRVQSAAEWGYMAADPSLPSRYAWSPADWPEHAGMMAVQPMGSSRWARCRMWDLPGGGEQVYPAPPWPRGTAGGPGGGPEGVHEGVHDRSDPPKRPAHGRWTPPDPADRVRPDGPMLRAAVLAALTDAPQGKDTIARTVGASPTTVRRILDGLAAEGLARNEGRGWTHTTGEQQ
jgi:hypothetical protein